ncbi:MAG TPA: hypothetical protein PKW20_01350, partial [Syntrophales bacterium]|nr:hypothetical protein [Syntrophales bacterium]
PFFPRPCGVPKVRLSPRESGALPMALFTLPFEKVLNGPFYDFVIYRGAENEDRVSGAVIVVIVRHDGVMGDGTPETHEAGRGGNTGRFVPFRKQSSGSRPCRDPSKGRTFIGDTLTR